MVIGMRIVKGFLKDGNMSFSVTRRPEDEFCLCCNAVSSSSAAYLDLALSIRICVSDSGKTVHTKMVYITCRVAAT